MTIRTLLYSTLYPSTNRPDHGIFVETRLRQLLDTGKIETKVVAPVPWFFSKNPIFGEYARVTATPRNETHNSIAISHPRYFVPPKIGMNFSPFTLAASSIPEIIKLQRSGFDFDLIDAHYVYPDGVAAAIIASYFKKPFTVTARGTDINLIPQYAIPRKLIQWTLKEASAAIGVCKALADEMASLGAAKEKIHVLRNGVNLDVFSPRSKEEARTKLSWDLSRKTLLSVGYLIERKGHHIAIEAMQILPEFQLKIIGRGPDQEKLQKLAFSLGVAERVDFIGPVTQPELATYYCAADILVLASSREGWANVLLESMACGTPVVATNIWGTPEVVSNADVGRLIPERTAHSLATGVMDILSNQPKQEIVRKYAENFSWEETSQGQIKIFNEILNKRTVS